MNKKRIAVLAAAAWMACMPLESGMNAFRLAHAEGTADEAERETDKAKKVQFMEHHIGEEFTGVISGISNYGFYVELPNTVEGMVRLANLDGDYYVFDEEHYELVGERTRKKYKLGQTVKIQVVSVDRYLKTIDFLPVRKFD